MNKADTLKGMYKIFSPEKPLDDENKEFYIDTIYKKSLNKLKIKLENPNSSGETFYVAGQSGNGKTSTINYLVNQKDITDMYNVIKLPGKEFFQEEDINIIDLLLMIGVAVVENDKVLEKKYKEEIESLYKENAGIAQSETITEKQSNKSLDIENKTELKVSFLGYFKNLASFKANYKLTKDIRTKTREVFNINKEKLIEKINNIILEFRIQKNDGKDVLLVIDDLEKKDIKHVKELFDIGITNYFTKIKAIKIISMPIILKRYTSFLNAQPDNVFEFGIKLKEHKSEEYIKESIDLLKEVVLVRLNDKSLIESEVLEKIIKMSGGNLRELIKIVNSSAFNGMVSGSDIITNYEFDEAIETIRRNYSSLVQELVRFLDDIRNHKMNNPREQLQEAFQNNLIFAYFNGHTWYDINPIIDESIDFYKGMM